MAGTDSVNISITFTKQSQESDGNYKNYNFKGYLNNTSNYNYSSWEAFYTPNYYFYLTYLGNAGTANAENLSGSSVRFYGGKVNANESGEVKFTIRAAYNLTIPASITFTGTAVTEPQTATTTSSEATTATPEATTPPPATEETTSVPENPGESAFTPELAEKFNGFMTIVVLAIITVLAVFSVKTVYKFLRKFF